MKAKVKVKVLTKGCEPAILSNGEWIDLRAAKDVSMTYPQAGREHQVDNKRQRDVNFASTLIPLGVAMKLPEGYEAVVNPRSSTFKKFGVLLTNSQGVIDNSYSGNEDEWKFNALGVNPCEIHGPREAKEEDYLNPDLTINDGITLGDRICQFRIQLSQKATFWQKLKWLFTSGVELKFVNNLDDNNRGGFGTTGY